jgi:hypothetical protein
MDIRRCVLLQEKNRKIILITALIMFLSTGCQPQAQISKPCVTKSMEITVESSSTSIERLEYNLNDTSPISFGKMALDKNAEQFFFGSWKIDSLLGFNYIYNDASEYPKGQKIICDTIIVTKDLFSSEGIINYKCYQYSIINPQIYIDTTFSNAEVFLVYNRVNRLEGNLNLKPNDIIRSIRITNEKNDLYPFSFYIVNNERVILLLEATYFELKKINDKNIAE